jgi:hypothetical protein
VILTAAALILFGAAAAPPPLAVSFPDGEVIEVRARQAPKPWRVDTSSATLAELYPTIRAQAATNGAAALLLSTLLDRCASAPADPASLESELARLRARPEAGAARNREERLMQSYRFCLGITDAQEAESFAWFQKAAALGDPIAVARLASTGGTTGGALLLHETAWRAGNLESAMHLGRLHELGRPDERAPDLARSLAYYYLFATIRASGLGSTEGKTPEWMESRLSAAGPEIRDASIALAKQLLRDNPNCCYRR